MSTNKSLPKEIFVNAADKTITIKKMGLGRYTEILDIANGLIKKMFNDAVDDFKKDTAGQITEDLFITNLILSISNYQDDVLKLIHIATYDSKSKQYQLSIDELRDDVSLEEAIDLITAILEVNNIFKVYEQIKKLKATILKK